MLQVRTNSKVAVSEDGFVGALPLRLEADMRRLDDKLW